MADWFMQTVRVAGIERMLKGGHVLFRAGDRSTGLYEVVSGGIRLVRVDRAGREVVLHVARAGEMLAEASLFASAYHCDAIAMTDAVLRLYLEAKVLAEFERNLKTAQAFMGIMEQGSHRQRHHLMMAKGEFMH